MDLTADLDLDGRRLRALTPDDAPLSAGIALRAVRVLTEWAHRDAGVPRLWLEIDPDNVGSQRLASRAGYRLEKRLPRHCRSWVRDDPADHVWHDCLVRGHVGPCATGSRTPSPLAPEGASRAAKSPDSPGRFPRRR
ncbi:GNAT family N-acetyltransferase [Streptomyces sp. D2-8]|uniref:GNAT family N-acetyltransferase n=1 Tax=Streptomyces sp. D2-8 TaxID=2707767 RepID=UPI0035B29EFE|nr:GNAT family N-acetyltransferase [Streptomyces sp. D2-8]